MHASTITNERIHVCYLCTYVYYNIYICVCRFIYVVQWMDVSISFEELPPAAGLATLFDDVAISAVVLFGALPCCGAFVWVPSCVGLRVIRTGRTGIFRGPRERHPRMTVVAGSPNLLVHAAVGHIERSTGVNIRIPYMLSHTHLFLITAIQTFLS